MTNAEAARILERIAAMLEIDGANPFRVRAYREAARVIESQGEPVEALAGEEGALEALQGIGRDLAQKIRDIVRTGTTDLHEQLKRKIPLAVVELTELRGLGPKRVKVLFDTLGIRDRAGLEAAAREGRLRGLPGFGEKVEQNVLQALSTASQWAGRILLAGAWPVAHVLADHVGRVKGVTQVEVAGSFRRRRETVGDLDLLVSGGGAAAVMEAFVTHADVVQVLARGETKSSVRMRSGLQVDLRHVPEESFGAALMYFTGSKAHNIELRRIALEKGLSLNEYGLTRGDRTVAARTEQEVYAALGLAWIPPELREADGEIELARDGRLPVLVEERDLLADLHMHTDRTDGRDTLEAMVRAARDRGYRYCAITDHSKATGFGRGFDEARVARSAEEIAAVRERVPGIHVLHGLEVDILADGALDLSDKGLAMLDWVVVAIHARLDLPPAAATDRVLRALDHPSVCAMAHPTGRMIGSREPARFDLERVLERAAERGVAMEINAQPNRMDLRDSHARLAREMGVRLVIDTDAHSTQQLEHMRYGVFTARRAGLTRHDVLNALPWEMFTASLRRPVARPATRGVSPAPRGAKRRASPAAPRAKRRASPAPRAGKSQSASAPGTATRPPSPARRAARRRASPAPRATRARGR